MPWPLYSRKELRYPLNKRLGGPQSGEEKHIFSLVEFKPQTIQPIV
jgi:hypothetical protein